MGESDTGQKHGSRSDAMMRLADADIATQVFVWAMRRWLDGVCGQQQVWSHFAARLGGRRAHRAMGAFEGFLSTLAHGARRPLQRGPSCCPLLHEDEASICLLLSECADCPLKQAVATARGLVRDGAEELAGLAVELRPLLEQVEPPQRQTAYGPFTPPPAPQTRPKRTLH